MRRTIGYVLSIVGMLAVAAAVIGGGFSVADHLIRPAGRPQDFVFITFAVSVLGAAFGVGLGIIGRHLSGLGGLVFPRIRTLVTSRPVIVIDLMVAAALWGMSAWFAYYILDGLMHKPYGDLTFDLLLGIPLGVLIPLAAGLAMYAASRIPAAPADADAPPPREAIGLLGYALASFGMFWLLFAGSCTWTGGFSSNATDLKFSDPALLRDVLFSFAVGAIFLTVGLWLRRVNQPGSGTPSRDRRASA